MLQSFRQKLQQYWSVSLPPTWEIGEGADYNLHWPLTLYIYIYIYIYIYTCIYRLHHWPQNEANMYKARYTRVNQMRVDGTANLCCAICEQFIYLLPLTEICWFFARTQREMGTNCPVFASGMWKINLLRT